MTVSTISMTTAVKMSVLETVINNQERQKSRKNSWKRQRRPLSICATDIWTAGCSILEGCCLSNLWEAITSTVLHTRARAHTDTRICKPYDVNNDNTYAHAHCTLHESARQKSN